MLLQVITRNQQIILISSNLSRDALFEIGRIRVQLRDDAKLEYTNPEGT